MAGLGEACTHIATILFAIDTTVKIRDSKTVTQEPAYWLLPATQRGSLQRGWLQRGSLQRGWRYRFHVGADKEKEIG